MLTFNKKVSRVQRLLTRASSMPPVIISSRDDDDKRRLMQLGFEAISS